MEKLKTKVLPLIKKSKNEIQSKDSSTLALDLNEKLEKERKILELQNRIDQKKYLLSAEDLAEAFLKKMDFDQEKNKEFNIKNSANNKSKKT